MERATGWRSAGWRITVLANILTSITSVTWGQTAPQAKPEESPLTAELVQQRIQLTTDDPQMEPAQKSEILDLYRRTLQDLSESAARDAALADFRRQEETAKPELDKAKALRAKPPETAPEIGPPANATLQDLEQELARKEQRLRDLTAALSQLDAEPKRRAARLDEIPQALKAARSNLEQADAEYTSLAEDRTPLGQAKRTALQSRRKVLRQKIETLEAERKAYEATNELVQVQRDIAAAAAAAAAEEEKKWRQLVNNRRRLDAERQASDARKAAIQASPGLRDLAQQVQQLAEERTELAGKIEDASRRLNKSRDLLTALSLNFDRAKQRVEASGLSQASGEILRQQRTMLPDLRKYREDGERRRTELGDMRFKAYERQDQRLALANLEQPIQEYVAQLPTDAPAEAKSDVRELLESQRKYLDSLISDYSTYYNTQLELSDVERQLIETADKYSNFIDERVLWIRSTFPWSYQDLKPASDAAMWLISRENWGNLASEWWSDVRNNLWLYIPFGLTFCLLLYITRPLKRMIRQLGEMVSRRGYYQFFPTVRAFGLTLLIAAIWPGLIGFLAWRLSSLYSTSPFVLAFSLALLETAQAALVLEFLRQVCRGQGLAECHLQWPLGVLGTTRRAARGSIFFGLPLLLMILTLEFQSTKPLWSASLGRMLFVALMLVATVMLDRLVRWKSGLLHHVLLYSFSTWVHRTRYVWAPIFILAPLALAVMALLGYYHTALVLGRKLFATGSLLLGLRVINDLLKRGVLMRRRRLTITQIRERRRLAELAAAKEGDSPRTVGAPTMQEIYDEVDLASVSLQSMKLLETVAVFLGFLGAWLIWVDVVPALTVLNNYPVWPTAQLTIGGLLLALVIGIVSVVAARNLPGVLELTLLHYLPVDAGARYATTTVVRYVIGIVGIAAVSHTLGFTLERAQWLIATMGIGLGFGLQEIFANFISGIILLFERPIRVGDVVTLDNTTGLVTRIRMRATTITDWDRKEYVVPNKDLVTGRLLNWTLTDLTNRIVIPVGVAYGTDTEAARNLLLETARRHPLILKDPEPIATFEGFGDSSLSLVLRCYLPSLEQRLIVIHELHTNIDRAFRKANIEIAYPRRDISIRTIEQPLHTVSEREHQSLT